MIKTRNGEGVGTRVYRFPDLRPAGVPFTRKHITTLEKRSEFPMHFWLGENSVGWVAAEVDAWVEGRIRRRGSPREAIRAKPRGGPPFADRTA
jgi:predicted DNA-binding transcriptional regulator AlpA